MTSALTRRALLGALAASGALSLESAFAAPPATCAFLAIGDWGRDGSPDQRAVAE